MTDSSKHTGDEAASAAAKVLTDGRTSETSKAAAASALSQAEQGARKSTGDDAAQAASETLLSDETGANSKKAAASALAQKSGDKA